MPGLSRQAERDRDVLMRIVALLVSMASLADRAAGLSGRRRRFLFQILSDAEAEGRELIIGLMPALSVQRDEPDIAGDAARLAASFRVLALVLYTMLRLQPARAARTPRRAGQGKQRRPVVTCTRVPAYDTS